MMKKPLLPIISDKRETPSRTFFMTNTITRTKRLIKNYSQQGKQWIENKYCWMNSENVNRAAAQGMYYAWHG